MVSFKAILSYLSVASLATTVVGTPFGWQNGGFNVVQGPAQCGKVNVFFTGLPANHPLVSSQGFDPAMVAAALAADKANILKGGYNLRTILIGPEEPMSIVQQEMRSAIWQTTGVGYGVRGSSYVNLTAHLEELIATFRERAPFAPIFFNHSPNSTLEALQRNVPISGDCSKTPGKDLGTTVYCDICPK